jgi:hypothetical protein
LRQAVLARRKCWADLRPASFTDLTAFVQASVSTPRQLTWSGRLELLLPEKRNFTI